MQLTKILFIFSLFFMFACEYNKEKISDLEKQKEALEKELEQAKDPATIDTLLQKLKLKEMESKRAELIVNIESISDKESCEAVRAEIQRLNEAIKLQASEYELEASEAQEPKGECTDRGFVLSI